MTLDKMQMRTERAVAHIRQSRCEACVLKGRPVSTCAEAQSVFLYTL
jgi:hypothetical protein